MGQCSCGSAKERGFRIVSDFRTASQQLEKVSGVMLSEHGQADEARFSGSLDLLQGYWQCPLAPDAEKIFTIATPVETVHAYACPARNFVRDLLLSSDACTRSGEVQLHGAGGRCDLLGVGRN